METLLITHESFHQLRVKHFLELCGKFSKAESNVMDCYLLLKAYTSLNNGKFFRSTPFCIKNFINVVNCQKWIFRMAGKRFAAKFLHNLLTLLEEIQLNCISIGLSVSNFFPISIIQVDRIHFARGILPFISNFMKPISQCAFVCLQIWEDLVSVW